MGYSTMYNGGVALRRSGSYLRFLILLLAFVWGDMALFGATNNQQNIEIITIHEGLAHNSVQSIVQDKYGFIWFGTINGLSRYDGYSIKNYKASNIDSCSISNNRIQLIYKDQDENLWVSSFDSLIYRYNYATDNFTRLAPSQVSKMVRDSTNRFINSARWHAANKAQQFFVRNGLLYVVNRASQTPEPYPLVSKKGLEINRINTVFVDKTDVLWVGTTLYGVVKVNLNEKPFMPHQNYIKLGNDSVATGIRAIYVDGDSTWLGSIRKGLTLLTDSERKKRVYAYPNTYAHSASNNHIRSICKDYTGDIWVGCNGGIDKIDGVTGQVQSMNNRNKRVLYSKDWKVLKQLPNSLFYALHEDAKRNLWIGCFDGVFLYRRDKKMFEFIDLSAYLDASIVTCIISDKSNNIWIGSEKGGVICLNYRAWAKHQLQIEQYNFVPNQGNSLPDRRVYALQEDITGKIWAGTANGLCEIDPHKKTVTAFDASTGLAESFIACLVFDANNNLWISHKMGISKLDMATRRFKNYKIEVISQGGEFIEGAGFYDKKTNTIYFGYSNGYVKFVPDMIQDNPVRPIAQLVDFKILNRTVHVNEKIDNRVVLTKPLCQTKNINLTHKAKSFAITFTTSHYANPKLNRFAYKLSGFDADWINTDASNRMAVYSNLEAGDYTFYLKAANGDNIWSEQTISLHIKVQPAWWNTWWAYLLYFVVIAVLAMLFVRTLLSRQRFRYLFSLEKIKADNVAELNQVKSDFFTKVSHELRTPLTLIVDPVERLLLHENNNEKRAYYQLIQNNSKRLLKLVNHLLDFRKLEENRMPLHLKPADVLFLVKEAVRIFEVNAQKQQVKVVVESEMADCWVFVDADKFESILINLISNAVKYAFEGSEVTLLLSGNKTVDKSSVLLELKVINQGKSIIEDDVTNIFEPFYQSDMQHAETPVGTGLGLAITKQLVELHGGAIELIQEDNHICFAVTMALKKAKMLAPEWLSARSGQVYANMDTVSLPNPTPAEIRNHHGNQNLPLVLLVDDNSEIRAYINTELSESYHFVQAANGTEALKLVHEIGPDIIISDIMMPLMDGFEFCKAIKSDLRTCHIPVILLTARHSDTSRTEGYDLGADAYIIKPFSIELLKARVNNLLKARHTLKEVFESEKALGKTENKVKEVESTFLSDLKAMIVEPNGIYNVEELAQNLHTNRTQLYRKIKALTGKTAVEFISEIRLNHAAEMLRNSTLNISEVAYALGYSEPANFSRSFNRFFGITPKEYQAKHRG